MKDETVTKVLCELEERAIKDIKKLLIKDDILPAEWDTAGKAVDIIKDIVTVKAMQDEYGEEEGASYRAYPRRYDGNYPIDRRATYNHEMSNVTANIRNLMNNATSENERMMYQRFLEEADRYKA